MVAFRIAAGFLAFVSLGFGIPGVFGAVHHARTGEVWRLWGFPTYGPGRFDVKPSTLTALMFVFVLACALAVVAAVLLWIPATAFVGAIAGLVLLLAHAVFWVAFELPFGPPFGAVAAVAIIVGLVLGSGSG